MRIVPAAIVLMLVLPSALAWNQLSGDAGHTGIAFLPDGAMDVLAIHDLSEDGMGFALGQGPGMVSTPNGLALLTSNSTCTLAYLAFPDGWATEDIPDCVGTGAVFAGYDDVLDMAFFCSSQVAAGQPLLQAVHLGTLTMEWSVSALDLGADTDQNTWSCGAPAIDPEVGAIYIPAVSDAGTTGNGRGTDHRIAKVMLETGEVEWSNFLDAAFFPQQSTGQQFDPTAPFRRTEPEAVTRTASGLVVMGEINDAAAAITLDLEGTITGIYNVNPATEGTEDLPLGLPPIPALPDIPGVTDLLVPDDGSSDGNAWAVASGPFAIAAIGNQILSLDPLLDGGSQFSAAFPASHPHPYIGPVLLQDLALVPARNGIIAIDGGNLQVEWQRLATPHAQQFGLAGALTATDGRIFTLESHPTFGERLLQLDPSSGKPYVSWPVPVNIVAANAASTRLTAAPGAGMVVLQEPSTIIVMGPRIEAGEKLGLRLSDTEPSSGTPVTLDVNEAAIAQNASLMVHWGDGSSSAFNPREELDHIYFGSGPKTITAVLREPDGTTWSETIEADVDAIKYSWIETQFLPENLDMTWGVIGFLLGGLGILTTYIVRQIHRRRMSREMKQLDRIREMAVDEPVIAMQQLRKYRHNVRERAKKGRLDDPPLASVLQEITKMFHIIEQRILSSFGGRMTRSMATAMNAAFADGVLSQPEIMDLRKRLKKESNLSHGEKRDLDGMLADWV